MNARSLLASTAAATLAPLEAILDPSYPESWRDIATSLYVQMRALDELARLADAHVARLALQLTEGLRAEIGGSQPYLSKGSGYELSLRDRQILAEYRGNNLDALAHKYGLTTRQMRNIVDAQIREEVARRQGRLPFVEVAE